MSKAEASHARTVLRMRTRSMSPPISTEDAAGTTVSWRTSTPVRSRCDVWTWKAVLGLQEYNVGIMKAAITCNTARTAVL